MTIDKATVEHCIALLRGAGEYQRQWKRQPYHADPEMLETWTFTTHPMDLLAPLIAPEPTEAEKLVNEWLGGCWDENDTDYVRLAQFILDKRNAERVAATPVAPSTDDITQASADTICSINAALGNCEPQYVFGPWIEWQGGVCPVPGDWMVDIVCRYETVEDYTQTVACATRWRRGWGWDVGRHRSDITHYRVRFEVGKWYDWAGGPCPVGPDVMVVVVTRDGWESAESWWAQGWSEGCHDWWKHEGYRPEDNITRFKIISPSSTGEKA